MSPTYPRVRIPGPVKYTSSTSGSGAVEHSWDRLIARDIVRVVFFVPRDHFELAAGVAHALDCYVRAVEDQPPALFEYTCCYWEPSRLGDRGWELIRATLNPKARRYFEDYDENEAFYPEKAGAEPYFGIYGEQDSGFSFAYHARLPWRDASPATASVLRVTLPTEYLEERGADFIRALVLDMASQLPMASGHAGLALDVAYSSQSQLGALRPLIFRHPGFDIRDASIHDDINSRVDGVHWMTFLGHPVLGELGGAEGLRAKLHSPSTRVLELDGERVLITLGPEPEAGDLSHGQSLPAYRELAQVLEPWQESFPWGGLGRQGRMSDEAELRRWWRRFLD